MTGSGCRNLNLALALSRREVIRAGGLGLLGLGLPRFLEARAASPECRPDDSTAGLGRILRQGEVVHFTVHVGRACPARDVGHEARRPRRSPGRVRPIATNVPGVSISEHFPILARQLDRLAVIRSVHHARREPHDRDARAVDRPADSAARRRRIP